MSNYKYVQHFGVARVRKSQPSEIEQKL